MTIHTLLSDPRLYGGDQPANPGRRAINHACAMRFETTDDCFRWLYDYASEPMHVGQANACDADAPLFSDAARSAFDRRFRHTQQGVWDMWSIPATIRVPRHKVYLNPAIADLPRFALRIGAHLNTPGVAAFKTVTQRWMAHRPDKFMVYFHDAQVRAAWLAETLPALADLRANPTPFTALFDARGMATVATDPDVAGESWRSALLRRIASHIIAGDAPAAVRSRLRADGIDPDRWSFHDD